MNTANVMLRSTVRKLGLIRAINFVRFKVLRLSREYEERFSEALLSSVKPGDIVWDIGANLGFYTQQFLERVGPSGKIVAFEPAPGCFDVLSGKFKDAPGVKLENAAMGAHEGKVQMHLDNDPLAATHQIMDGAQDSAESNPDAGLVEVPVISGDSYWTHNKLTPNVIKIDVEGYEEQVLHGMSKLLKSRDLRSIFCEIHFALLEQRGERMAPVRIEDLLKTSGFNTTWIDASHIQATRN